MIAFHRVNLRKWHRYSFVNISITSQYYQNNYLSFVSIDHQKKKREKNKKKLSIRKCPEKYVRINRNSRESSYKLLDRSRNAIYFIYNDLTRIRAHRRPRKFREIVRRGLFVPSCSRFHCHKTRTRILKNSRICFLILYRRIAERR